MAGVRFTDLQSRPTEFLDFTSLTLDEFHQLVPPFEAAFQAHMAAWRLDGKPRTARQFRNEYLRCGKVDIEILSRLRTRAYRNHAILGVQGGEPWIASSCGHAMGRRCVRPLGYSVEVVAPDRGVSVRGTSDDKLFSGDVVRKLLVQMEQQADLSQPAQRLPQEPSVAVKVRERASRRAVKQAINEAEAAARAYQVAEQLVGWYNQHVGVSMLQYARLGRGRRLHILDTTHVEVALETGTYECSGVVKNDDGTRSRGYKLATLRTLLDRTGLLTQMAMSAIQVHDMALCRPLLAEAPVLRAGDLLLEDRGFIDGATLSALKRQRQVDVIIPLKANMLATQEAIQLAEMANTWQPHPSRAAQTIALVRGVEHMWTECEVPLNACVIRFWNKKKKCTDHIVLITTDLKLSSS